MAKCVVLEHESRQGFDSMHSAFVARFQPTDGVELGLVEEMLSAFWRQRRTWAIETRIMDNAIATQPPDEDELTRLADGFTSLAGQPPLELIHRYETRLHRIFQRALANLIQMRSQPELTPPENIELPNDPSPISEQLPEPPPAENIRLPNDPSPISGQSPAPPVAHATTRAASRPISTRYIKCTERGRKCIRAGTTIPLHMPPKPHIINNQDPGVRIALRKVCSRSS
jgi:hypothetical protein